MPAKPRRLGSSSIRLERCFKHSVLAASSPGSTRRWLRSTPGDPRRNNDFDYGDDPFQRRCPYAAHIRKVYPRDDAPGGEAEAQTHRIRRAGITFGPEVKPGETTTRHSRGLMFV